MTDYSGAGDEVLYRDFFDAVDFPCVVAEIVDLQGEEGPGADFRCVDANAAFRRLSNAPHPVGLTLRELIPQTGDLWITKYAEVVRTGEPARFQDRLEGVRQWFDIFAARIGAPESRRIVIVFTDITPRKEAEAALLTAVRHVEQQTRIFDTTLSSILDFAYIFDLDGRFVYSNQALLDLLGITIAEIAGKNFFDLHYPDDLAARLQRQIQEVIDTRSVVIDETPFLSPAGIDGFYEYIFTPVFGSDGRVEVVAGSTRNITERKRIQQALAASEERSRIILESITDAFLAVDEHWHFTFVNRHAERLLGCAFEQLLGKTMWDAFPALIGTPFERAYRHTADSGEASSVTAFYPDHHRWYEAHVYAAGKGITIYFRDATERVQAEDDLRRSRDELELRVAERTHELQRANASLLAEMRERERSEGARLVLLQQLADAQEDERRRISREMHDSLGQHLTALTLGLKETQALEACPPSVRDRIARLSDTAIELDEQIDRLSHELRPLALDDLGLHAALARHAQAWSDESGIPVELHMRHVRQERIPATIETTAYRIVQEALTNIRKHACATRVSLVSERLNGELRVIIEDDGAGFDADHLPEGAGSLGLKGMSERAALVAGRVEIETSPGRGATIYLSIPLPQEAVREPGTA